MTSSTQEALWVLRAQCGDREALECLLRSIQPSLRGLVRGIVGSSSVDDVVQDALVVVCRKLTSLHTPQLFKPWCFRIAARCSFRHLKKEKRWLEQQTDEFALDDLPAERVLPAKENLEELLSLENLSPASRAVMVLHFQEELPLAEVAAILELPMGTVKSRLAYGLSAIRKHIKTRSNS